MKKCKHLLLLPLFCLSLLCSCNPNGNSTNQESTNLALVKEYLDSGEITYQIEYSFIKDNVTYYVVTQYVKWNDDLFYKKSFVIDQDLHRYTLEDY